MSSNPQDPWQDWPPKPAQKLVDEIEASWNAHPHEHGGEHFALIVRGNNPITGYLVVHKAAP